MARSRLRRFVIDLFRALRQHHTFDLAAQLAYWSLLALFPFAIFLLTVIGYLPLRGLDAELMDSVYRVMPFDAAKLIDTTVHEVVGRQRGGLLLVSLVGGLWSASGGVQAVSAALNRAFEVQETRPWWKRKAEALGITFLGALLVVVALVSLLIGPGLVHKLWAYFGLGGAFDVTWSYLRWPLCVFSLMVLLAVVYWLLPNAEHRLQVISAGSVAAVLAWILATVAFNFYVRRFHTYAKTYGALGAAVILLTWLYMSGLLVIVGGEINAAIERLASGSRRSAAAFAKHGPSKH